MRLKLSLKQMITAGSVGLFASGMLIMISITAGILWSQSRTQTDEDLARSKMLIQATLQEMSSEVRTYAGLLARSREVAEALAGDKAALGPVLQREFDELKRLDPHVNALEALTPDGVVLRRGHNPGQSGDSKAQQGVVRAAMKDGSAVALTYSTASRALSTSAYRSIVVGGKVVAFVGVGKRIERDTLERIKHVTGTAIFVSHNGSLVASTRPDIGAPQVAPLTDAAKVEADGLLAITSAAGVEMVGRGVGKPMDDGSLLLFVSALERSVITAKFWSAVTWPLLGGLLAMALLIPVILVISSRFSSMIEALSATMRTLAEGRTDVDIPHGERADEIGAMAKAIAVFRENGVRVREADALRAQDERQRAERLASIEMVNADIAHVIAAAVDGRLTERVDTREVPPDLLGLVNSINHLLAGLEATISRTVSGLESMAAGQLDARIDDTENGDFRRLTVAANTLAEGLGAVVGGMVTATGDVKLATDEIQSGITDLAARTAQQADISAETTSRLAAFAATFRETSEMTGAVARKAGVSERQALSGEELVQRLRDAMSRISTSSRRIADITAIIDDVAFQTNLLALNASVEAARAGEAGKGFAVVASEVRTLAQRAAEASRDVKQLIDQAVAEVSTGEKTVAETDVAFREIAASIQQIAEEVRTTAGSAERQAGAVGALSTEIERLGDMAQQNAALVEEADAMLVRTNSRIADLVGLADKFQTQGAQSPVRSRLAA